MFNAAERLSALDFASAQQGAILMTKAKKAGSGENDLIHGSDKSDHLFGWSGHDG